MLTSVSPLLQGFHSDCTSAVAMPNSLTMFIIIHLSELYSFNHTIQIANYETINREKSE
jgi:hypothetical protein